MKEYSFEKSLLIIGSVAAVAAGVILWSWSQTTVEQVSLALVDSLNHKSNTIREVWLHEKTRKPEKREVKAIYLTAYSAGSSATVDRMIELINATELNGVIVDIKDYTGMVLYDSDVELINEFGLEDDRLGDVRALIEKFHEHDIYVMARQTVFQDPILASVKPEWAIASKNGGLWYDHKGLSWVDPTQRSVWEYNVQIAKEAIALGFDEINFDYVRFPSDGNMSLVVYTNGDQERYDVMGDFYQYLSDELSEYPAYISLDLFGFVMERHDGMSIGQRLEDAVDVVDYVSPMMYPSHYPPGHLGFENPAAYPAAVIQNGMQKGVPYFEDERAEVRPWIQAFDLGGDYRDGSGIRAQIDQVEAYTDAGWLLWDARNVYTSAGLAGAETGV